MKKLSPKTLLAFSMLAFVTALQAESKPNASAVSNPSAEIDRLVMKGLRENELKPNPFAPEEVLVRRIYLDLVGRVPTRSEAETFLASKEKNKVAKVVDGLIGSDGYVSHQYNYWADLLRLKSRLAAGGQSIAPGMAYEMWLKDAIRNNKPYDEMVFDMVTAHGSSWENPAIGYYLRDYGMPLDNLAITTQVFLGTQIVCAQCHDHPFDETTQMDYYHLAAFTYPMVTSNNHPGYRSILDAAKKVSQDAPKKFTKEADMRRAASEILFPVRFNNVFHSDRRKLRLPHDYQYDDAEPKSIVEPGTLMGPEAVISGSTTLPEAFGSWLTSPENPRFAKVIANRLWREAFGVGLIEPHDDLKEHTRASNPELMDYLTQLLINLDFDLQAYQRAIYLTKTYRRESSLEAPTPGAPYHFAGPILRRMSAEQIWDSLVTLVVENPDQPSAARKLNADMRLAKVQLIGEAIYDQKPKQFARNMVEVVRVQKALAEEIEAATNLVAEARKTDDEAKIKEAQKEAGRIRSKLYKLVEEKVYREGIEAKVETVSLQKSDEDFLNDLAATIAGDAGQSFDDGMSRILGEDQGDGYGVIDPIIDAMFAEEKEAIAIERKRTTKQQMKQWKIQPSGQLFRDYQRNWKRVEARMVRASEVGSPSPPGHFLREFGQSDRELVENANDEASITQALAMLNGDALGAVTNRYSVLSRDMKGETFRERLDTIYMSMLSRKPTAEEVAIFREAWNADPESGTFQGIVWTVLNMRQFLFIQ